MRTDPGPSAGATTPWGATEQISASMPHWCALRMQPGFLLDSLSVLLLWEFLRLFTLQKNTHMGRKERVFLLCLIIFSQGLTLGVQELSK